MADIEELQNKLGVTFENIKLLEQAVVHRSYLNEHPDHDLDQNERLEFLGDAVLEIVVTSFLYHNYSNPEGELTSIRSALVNSEMLSKKAHDLEIEKYLKMSHGESKDTGRARDFILANAYEAVVGAIYLDQGLKKAQEFIEKNLLDETKKIVELGLHHDPKSKFQEIAQEKFRITPEYRVLEESGPDHDKKFVVGLYLTNELISKGEGSSKQIAQVEAARNGIKVKGW